MARRSLGTTAVATLCLALGACGGGGGGATGGASGVVIANAGPDQVARVGLAVMLDGRASFASGGGALAYRWTQTAGPAAVFLTAPHSALPNFVATVVGTYEFELQVTPAAGGSSSTDRATVTAVDDGKPSDKISPAADLRVAGLSHAVLLGDAPPLVHAPPPTVAFADGAERPATFVDLAADPLDDPAPATVAGLVRIDVAVSGSPFASLYVTPGIDAVEPTEVEWGDGTRAPVLRFGTVGSAYLLDGTRSHDDGTIVNWNWRHVTGALDFDTPLPQIDVVPGLSQTYEWELVVTDDVGLTSFPRRIQVPVVPAGGAIVGPPLARLVVRSGADAIVVGAATAWVSEVGRLIGLDAATSLAFSGGAPETGPGALAYDWRQRSGPPAAVGTAGAAQATFSPSSPGAYQFEVTVTDANGVSDAADVWISVAAAGGEAPVAAIAPVADPILASGGATPATVLLVGTQSVGELPLSYHWTQVAGTPVFVEAPSLGTGKVVLSQRGLYEFELRVFDGFAFSPPATVSFHVR